MITFLTKSDVLIFPNKSKWTELIDLLADDVRGRHSRSVYVHFIAHRLNKHGFSCPTWAKQENATRKRETWNTMELLSQCYTYSLTTNSQQSILLVPVQGSRPCNCQVMPAWNVHGAHTCTNWITNLTKFVFSPFHNLRNVFIIIARFFSFIKWDVVWRFSVKLHALFKY